MVTRFRHLDLVSVEMRPRDPLGVGQIYQDEYEEENIGYQIGTVSRQLPILFFFGPILKTN